MNKIIGIEQNEKLLADILRTGREVGIEAKPTCAPRFMCIADQVGIEMRYSRGRLAGLAYCVVGRTGSIGLLVSFQTASPGRFIAKAISSKWLMKSAKEHS